MDTDSILKGGKIVGFLSNSVAEFLQIEKDEKKIVYFTTKSLAGKNIIVFEKELIEKNYGNQHDTLIQVFLQWPKVE